MLKLTGITRSYKDNSNVINALNGVNLTIQKGDMVGIMGPSGSGKSTLLHIMGLLDTPSSGTYQMEESNVTTLTDKERASLRNKHFGFILQQFALIEEETALENVSVPLLFSDKKLLQVDDMAFEMLKLLKMEAVSNKKVRTLSGGEKQRIAIGRALVNHPEIILADEPTGSLDSKNTEQIMEVFKDLNQKGKTVVIITHNEFVAKCCNKCYNPVFDSSSNKKTLQPAIYKDSSDWRSCFTL